MAISLETLLPPGRVAFVLTEVQEGIIGDLAPWPALAVAAQKVELVKNAARVADAARTHGAPVIHCTADNLPGQFGANRNARLYGNSRKRTGDSARDPRFAQPPEQVWREGDILLPRFHGTSPMTGSPLDSLLRNQGVTTLIVCGVSLCFGVLSLTIDAANRSYQVILVEDAVAGFPEDYAQQVVVNTLSMLATVAPAEKIIEAWRNAHAALA